jgi:hypothetical protein
LARAADDAEKVAGDFAMLMVLLLAYLVGCYAWGMLMLWRLIARRTRQASRPDPIASDSRAATRPWTGAA